MEFGFWLCLCLIIYCYFGYPLILVLLTKIFSQPVQKHPIESSISIILAVFNEEDVMKRKLDNIFSLDYPKEKMEILIGSDGSTDQTVEIIKSNFDPRVRLFAYQERRGKMLTLNDLVAQARSEILIFMDARQEFAKNSLKELVANFADKRVGCASGELMFSRSDHPTAKGINLYWSYEKFLRAQESRLHSMLGATGAIYAIRRPLFRPIPRHIVLDDMYVPFQIIKQGYRAIFDASAKAYDEAAVSAKEEHHRKARTLFGNYQIFGLFASLFNPFTSPIAVQFFSHKFLRVVAPFLMIAAFIINVFLTPQPFYKNLFVLQIFFYTMAAIGGLARNTKYGMFKAIAKVCYVPYVFCLLNFSALSGFFRFLFSEQQVTWQKAREAK
jgi:biofilm PGA synthesis N-glycosyltransferase PgaC